MTQVFRVPLRPWTVLASITATSSQRQECRLKSWLVRRPFSESTVRP